MADEQRRLTGTDLVEFEQAFDLSTAECSASPGARCAPIALPPNGLGPWR
jgi:hypothetical protein